MSNWFKQMLVIFQICLFTLNALGCYVWGYVDALAKLDGASKLVELHALGLFFGALVAFCTIPLYLKQ